MVDPRRAALRTEISHLFGRAEAPSIDETESRSRVAAAHILTSILTGNESSQFTAAITSAAAAEPDRTIAGHLCEVAANLPAASQAAGVLGQFGSSSETGTRA
jgi:hypothetical protein